MYLHSYYQIILLHEPIYLTKIVLQTKFSRVLFRKELKLKEEVKSYFLRHMVMGHVLVPSHLDFCFFFFLVIYEEFNGTINWAFMCRYFNFFSNSFCLPFFVILFETSVLVIINNLKVLSLNWRKWKYLG